MRCRTYGAGLHPTVKQRVKCSFEKDGKHTRVDIDYTGSSELYIERAPLSELTPGEMEYVENLVFTGHFRVR